MTRPTHSTPFIRFTILIILLMLAAWPVMAEDTPPQNLTPADGSTLNSANISFSWTPVTNPTLYKLVVKNKAAGYKYKAKLTPAEANCDTTGCTFTPSGETWTLQSGITYAWKVVAKGDFGDTNKLKSSRFTFTTNLLPPSIFALTAPAQGASVETGTTQTFTWEKALYADRFKLVVKDPTGEKILKTVIDASACNPSCSHSMTSPLDDLGLYKWKVKAINPYGRVKSKAEFTVYNPTMGDAYYVDQNHASASDSNPGTLEQPWLTVQHAAASVQAGDAVIVMPGSYQERVRVEVSGSAGQPILFQAQGNVEIVGFKLTGDYIQVKGFTVKVFICGNNSYGIEISGDNFLIENNDFIETVEAGVYTSPITANGVITGNYFYRSMQNAIQLHGENHLIDNNEIRRPLQDHPVCSDKSDDANGIWLFGTGHVVRGNDFYEVWYGENVRDAHMDCIQTFGGWENGDPERNTNILIENNYCDANSWQTSDESGSGFQMEDVSSSDGTFAGGIIIRNNVVLAPQCSGGQQNTAFVTFVNNTCISDPAFIANGSRAMDYWPSTSYDNHHYRIQNNIFYNYNQQFYISSSVYDTGTVELGYNLSYRSDGVVSTGVYFECDQENNVCADPVFVNANSGDYHPGTGSAAIDAGLNLGALVPADMDGTPRPQGSTYDIGAYEK